MKINTSMLWEDKAKSEVTYTTYLIEKATTATNNDSWTRIFIF